MSESYGWPCAVLAGLAAVASAVVMNAATVRVPVPSERAR